MVDESSIQLLVPPGCIFILFRFSLLPSFDGRANKTCCEECTVVFTLEVNGSDFACMYGLCVCMTSVCARLSERVCVCGAFIVCICESECVCVYYVWVSAVTFYAPRLAHL